MPSTFSQNLRLELIGAGEQAGTWNITTNNNLGDLIEQAISGATDLDVGPSDITLTALNGVTDQARSAILNITGSPATTRTVTIPNVSKTYTVKNRSDSTVNIKTASGAAFSIPTLSEAYVYCDSNNAVTGRVITDGANTITSNPAPFDSPAFTGVPTAPTPAAGTNTTQIATTAFVNSALPVGSVIMWYGSLGDVPTGWQICNGTNGTPDLRNRFVVGAGDDYSLGNTGGANTVTLNTSQIPAHNHPATASTQNLNHTHSGTTNNAGGHDHTGTTNGNNRGHIHSGTTASNNRSHSHSGTTGNNNRGHSHSGTTASQNRNHSHGFSATTGSNNRGHTHSGSTNNGLTQGGTIGFTTFGGAVANASGVFSRRFDLTGQNAAFGSGATVRGFDFNGTHAHSFTTGGQSANHEHSVSGTTGTQSANHEHAFSTGGESQNHVHAFSTGTQSANHEHTFSTGGESQNHTHTFTTSTQADHQHPFTTGGMSANASHSHSITVNNAGGGGAHENRPPYLALFYIMRI